MEMGAGARRGARKSSKIMMTARREAKMKGKDEDNDNGNDRDNSESKRRR